MFRACRSVGIICDVDAVEYFACSVEAFGFEQVTMELADIFSDSFLPTCEASSVLCLCRR